MKIIYLPLEHIDMRYTTHLDRDIVNHFNDNEIEFVRIYPDVPISKRPPTGMFLNPAYTISFKNMQLAYLAEMFSQGRVQDDDIIFVSDLWFPGLESVAYLKYFYGKTTQLRGLLHAGSFTDTDFTRDMERWASHFENVIFDIASKVYVSSNFIATDVIKKRLIDPSIIEVTPFPLDYQELDKYKNMNGKQKVVIFNGRNCGEKQPHLFEKLKHKFRKNKSVQFFNTQEQNLPKQRYYELLSMSKVVVSFALQENFGFGIAEATYLGCKPVLPRRLVYPEFYEEQYLYDTFDECVKLIKFYLNEDDDGAKWWHKRKYEINTWFE